MVIIITIKAADLLVMISGERGNVRNDDVTNYELKKLWQECESVADNKIQIDFCVALAGSESMPVPWDSFSFEIQIVGEATLCIISSQYLYPSS